MPSEEEPIMTEVKPVRVVTEEEKIFAKNFNINDYPDIPPGLPPHLELQRTHVICKKDAPIHTVGVIYSGAYSAMGVDNSVKLENFSENFKVNVIKCTETDMEFDMIGIDPAIANAFRRILIAELPTMAFEKVLIANNTSLIQDEVLAQRIGLVPIAADPRLFEYLSENDQPNEKNTIVFKLHVKYPEHNETKRSKVLTDQLIWLPNGSELIKESGESTSKPKTYTSFSRSQDSFPEFAKNPIKPSVPNILLAKLGRGQEIELEAHAVKGVGRTHAKWSPVGTAWYRMLPEVVLVKDVEGKLADELVKTCKAEVFDIEDMGKGRKRAVVAKPRNCTLCRECLSEKFGIPIPPPPPKPGQKEEERKKEWIDRVEVRRVRNHFIFTIESTGSLPPEVLFTEAVKILEDKCETVITQFS